MAIAGSVADGVAAVAEHMPEVCLLDLRFTGPTDGIVAVRAIQRSHPDTAVVLFSGATDPAAGWRRASWARRAS